MFDTPDFSPLFILCPGVVFLSVGIYFIVYSLAKRRLKKPTSNSQNAQLVSLIVAIVSFLALCSFATMLLNTVYLSPPTPLFKPTNRDLVGTWRLSDNTIEYLQRKDYTVTSHELVFNDDGTFRMANVPGGWRYWDKSPEKKYITGSGIWQINKLQYWSIEGKFQAMNGQSSDEWVEFWVIGVTPPYSLLINLGDMAVGVNFQRE